MDDSSSEGSGCADSPEAPARRGGVESAGGATKRRVRDPGEPAGVTQENASFQLVVYRRALHPERFRPRGRRVVATEVYECEAWVMLGGHALRVEHRGVCVTELVCEAERPVPTRGVEGAFPCTTERDFRHAVSGAGGRIRYAGSVQVEQLPSHLYMDTYRELVVSGRAGHALMYTWHDSVGECLSMVELQRYRDQLHAQTYHMVALSGQVLRGQVLVEFGVGGETVMG